MTEHSIDGACLCGSVRYRLTGPAVNFQYCHCSRCRKFTGSAHASNLFVLTEHLEWVEGEDQVGRYSLDVKPGFNTAWCKSCGSSLPNMSATGRHWLVPAGTLERDPEARPLRNIFWDSRAPWFVGTGELPVHEELPPEGE